MTPGRGEAAPDRNLLVRLNRTHDAYGCLPEQALADLARDTGLPVVDIYAAATFYRHLWRAPAGRHVIRVCQGVPCYLKRNLPVIEAVRDALGIAPGQTSSDGLFTLELVNCIGACDRAPAMMIDEDVFGHVTPEGVGRILEGYRRGAGTGGAG